MPIPKSAHRRALRRSWLIVIFVGQWLLEFPAGAQPAASAAIDFLLQYRTCTVTTSTPIYNSGAGPECGVLSTRRYSDNSCPVANYNQCRDQSHGVEDWVDVTSKEGSWNSPSVDGYGSVDGCTQGGDDFDARANSGRIPGLKAPANGYRYGWRTVVWNGTDTRDPVFGGRVKASHYCTFKYGVYRARYYALRSSACGVEERAECKVATTYNTCLDAAFGIDRYETVDKRDSSCGLRLEPGWVGIAEGTQVTIPAPKFDAPAADVRRSALCVDASGVDRFFCMRLNMAAAALGEQVDKAKAEPIRKAIVDFAPQTLREGLSAGDIRLALDELHEAYADDKSLGWSTSQLNKEFHTDLRQFIGRIPDDQFFPLAGRLARQALTATPTVEDGATSYYFDPLWNILTESDQSRRRVPFSAIADLQILLGSVDLKTSAKLLGQGLVICEFYARLVAAYVQARASDVLQLQALAARLEAGSASVTSAAEQASNQVRAMKLRPEVEAAALQGIASRTSTSEFRPVLQELMSIARDDIRISIASATSTVGRLSQGDTAFKTSLGTLHLLQRNYNHATLVMREGAQAMRQMPNLAARQSRAEDSLTRFQRNFNDELRNSLEKAKAVVARLTSDSTLTLDSLGIADQQFALSFALMDALQQVNMTVGKSLDGARLLVLNQLGVMVIEPLTAAVAEIE